MFFYIKRSPLCLLFFIIGVVSIGRAWDRLEASVCLESPSANDRNW